MEIQAAPELPQGGQAGTGYFSFVASQSTNLFAWQGMTLNLVA